MSLLILAALLLLACCVSGTNLLYVTSHSGTLTTLNMTTTSRTGGQYPAMKVVAMNNGCTASPAWLTLDHYNSLLLCVDEGLNKPSGSLSSYRTNNDGTVELLGKVTTTGGPISGSFYGNNNKGFVMAH